MLPCDSGGAARGPNNQELHNAVELASEQYWR
jgi:hypothetical protein